VALMKRKNLVFITTPPLPAQNTQQRH